MRIDDVFMLLRGALAHRSRTALTLLGVIIGTGSIVLLASLLKGGEEALLRANQGATDSDLVQVRQDDVPFASREKTQRALSRGDATVLAGSRLLGNAMVAGEGSRETRAYYEGRRKRVTLVSANAETAALYRLDVDHGRFVDDDDVIMRRRICIVGQEVWSELLEKRADLTGLRLMIDDELFAVVGVLKNKPMMGSTSGTSIWNRKVLIPETTYDATLETAHAVNRIYVRTSTLSQDATRSVVRSTLLRRHFGVENFKMKPPANSGQERLILNIVKYLLLSTGLLALFASGINIMNVMLVTVTERTREIGVRRAVGATRSTILGQFLLESAFVATLGGVLGVLAGLGVAWGASRLLARVLGRWELYVEPWSIAVGLALALATGILFGSFPAWRASRLDPIEALRFE